MSFEILCRISLMLAAFPCVLFLLNLAVYRRLEYPLNTEPASVANQPDESEQCASSSGGDSASLTNSAGRAFTRTSVGPVGVPRLSILIPARNEEGNIQAAVESVLANHGVGFEVLILNDHSTDRTAEIVRDLSSCDPRVRLLNAPPLPPGWCGKQHGCQVLSESAMAPLLLFLDADVRLAPDALRRISGFMERTGTALASGVPQQVVGTFSERLLVPLVHFILLGYLPFHWARRSKSPAFAAGCGQLVVVRAEAYAAVGGHAVIRTSLHDGIKLPRAFRRAGFRTELFDPTDLAACRMYSTDGDVWRGLGKNAIEGLAAPGTIGFLTILLLGGQVLPWCLLGIASVTGFAGSASATAAILAGLLPRLISVWRFRQPGLSAWLHPLGVTALLAIQWAAFYRYLVGRPSEWKGRRYPAPELQFGAADSTDVAIAGARN